MRVENKKYVFFEKSAILLQNGPFLLSSPLKFWYCWTTKKNLFLLFLQYIRDQKVEKKKSFPYFFTPKMLNLISNIL